MSKVIRVFAVLAVTAVAAFSGAGTANASTVPASVLTLGPGYLTACIAYEPCANYLRQALTACHANAYCEGQLQAFLAANPEIKAIVDAFEASVAV